MQFERMKSPRLNFRKINFKDFDFLFRYHSDPELTQYLPLGKPYSQDQVERYLEDRLLHWVLHRFGTFLISLKSMDKVVGYCGLEYVTDTACVDIRYGVVRDMWCEGIATEAAHRCLELGFSELNLDAIYGAAYPENIPSLKVLGNIGMRPCKDVHFYSDVVDYFKITQSDYLKKACKKE